MKKVTEYLGKPVLSILESTTQGIVKDMLFDKNFKKLKYVVLFEDNDLQEEKFVAINDIYSTGENALVIKNNSCIDSKAILTDETSNPINNFVYTTSGKFLGVVSDITVDEKNFIKEILLSNGQILGIEKVLNSGKDTMFVQDENNYVKLTNFKRKPLVNAVENEKIKVTIMSNEPTNELEKEQEYVEANALEEKVEPIKPKRTIILNDACLPASSTTKNNFLIGRKVQKNIYSFNHELIIKKNTRITEKIILLAKSHSKFKELSLNSL